jgi:NAD(P)H-dependent flavin oxidoreductase YrpB (nitropropane dioxygenase family)
MNVAAGPELAAAVTNAGGLGVIGGLGYTPKMLRGQVSYLFLGLRSHVSRGSDISHDTDQGHKGAPER